MFNNNNFYDPVRLFRCYQLIDKQTGKYGTYKLNNKKGICGNCQVEINNSVNYIRHIIKTCRCPNHEDNNY
jgi:succinate dehydrogenase/fumarate reductase-like Fe-S protein